MDNPVNGKPRTQSMALFCDFENIALGVRDAKYEAFDIKKVLERLLLRGNIVVKKAYSDWDRYKEFKAAMHEAAFELIEIPHFSPLASKLRENNKMVLGVGVRSSTSDLLMSNCDEFILYDDLVREARKLERTTSRTEIEDRGSKIVVPGEQKRKQKALDLVMATVEDLFDERGEEEKVWGSMVKQALKRRNPGFSESSHGFKTFGQLLEEAQARKLLELERDEKSGGYIIKGFTLES